VLQPYRGRAVEPGGRHHHGGAAPGGQPIGDRDGEHLGRGDVRTVDGYAERGRPGLRRLFLEKGRQPVGQRVRGERLRLGQDRPSPAAGVGSGAS
jgi:hypothetical protein